MRGTSTIMIWIYKLILSLMKPLKHPLRSSTCQPSDFEVSNDYVLHVRFNNILTSITGSQNLFAAIPLRQPPPNKILDVLDHLLKLDSPVAPGLLQDEFRKLFVKCHCGKVTTRRAFKAHICVIFRNVPVVDLTVDDDIAVVGPVVIDLTGDSDEDIAMV